MSSPLQALLDALDAKPLGDDRFEARSIENLRPRVFGGELLAQVLATAARTVQDRACHAIHVDFLFPGDPKVPIEYGVRRVRDGRRFVQRQVSGYQHGREIVLATVSFTTDSADAVGFQHERMPEVPGPEGLTSELDQRLVVADRFAPEHRAWLTMPRAVEVRHSKARRSLLR
jgi:acyl-CoA thioesterase II